MTAMDYMKELNVAITVCDKEGKILQMNDKSQMTNHGDLVGQNGFVTSNALFEIGRAHV